MGTEELARLAQRILVEMLALANNASTDNRADTMGKFKGFGISLAFVYEEYTGQSAMHMTPKKVMEWAMNLPIPPKRMVV